MSASPLAAPRASASWAWQLQNRIRTLAALEAHLDLADEERAGVAAAASRFDWGVSPYYLSLIDRENPDCPIRLQCVPRASEADVGASELVDPLGEDTRMPVPGIVHRYPDRALLLTTDRCAVYCRYCTRRRLVGETERQLSRAEVTAALDYVRAHTEIREVILSGGDPLVSGDRFLDALLGELRAIPHVEMLRIHSRMPVVCPMRITSGLVAVLRRHQPLFVITHFNHPYELTQAAAEGLAALVDAGVPVGNQAVLLRGVNSDPVILEALGRELLRHRVWPYYLHQGDLAAGTESFRTPLALGLQILEELRGRVGGLAIPRLIVDLPDGGGKIALSPDRLVSHEDRDLVFRAPLGGTRVYTDVTASACECSTTEAVRTQYRIA